MLCKECAEDERMIIVKLPNHMHGRYQQVAQNSQPQLHCIRANDLVDTITMIV
jgi:hypothetical protein